MLGEALYCLVMQVIDDIYTIPTPLSMFFKAAQDKIQEKTMHSPHNSVALKVSTVNQLNFAIAKFRGVSPFWAIIWNFPYVVLFN